MTLAVVLVVAGPALALYCAWSSVIAAAGAIGLAMHLVGRRARALAIVSRAMRKTGGYRITPLGGRLAIVDGEGDPYRQAGLPIVVFDGGPETFRRDARLRLLRASALLAISAGTLAIALG